VEVLSWVFLFLVLMAPKWQRLRMRDCFSNESFL
jgi:hypothetical protein